MWLVVIARIKRPTEVSAVPHDETCTFNALNGSLPLSRCFVLHPKLHQAIVMRWLSTVNTPSHTCLRPSLRTSMQSSLRSAQGPSRSMARRDHRLSTICPCLVTREHSWDTTSLRLQHKTTTNLRALGLSEHFHRSSCN
jgi:hypothetical protein